MNKIKLLCFPYAGGSAIIYEKWKKYLNGDIEVCPIELPGRGKRFNDALYDNLDDLTKDIYNSIAKIIDDSNYAFFGHSMGALIAYELSHKIIERNNKKPIHLFVSGRTAPNIERDRVIMHNLPDNEFKEELLKLEGTPPELFESEELLEIFMPILRSDFKLVETYTHKPKMYKLDCDIDVFYGEKDDMTLDKIVAWRNHTNGNCNIYGFPGKHFFINDNVKNITSIINNVLLK